MTDFVRDILYAFRLIRKAPMFDIYVIVPLALGIGLNGAIFILLDTLLLRPLPVRNPEQLVRLVQVVQNLGQPATTATTFLKRSSASLPVSPNSLAMRTRTPRCAMRAVCAASAARL